MRRATQCVYISRQRLNNALCTIPLQAENSENYRFHIFFSNTRFGRCIDQTVANAYGRCEVQNGFCKDAVLGCRYLFGTCPAAVVGPTLARRN